MRKIAFQRIFNGVDALGNQPFSVYRLKNKPNYYVQFKNETTGCFTSAISTRKSNESEAIKTAWAWYANGIPRKESKQAIAERSLIDTIRKADLTQSNAEKLISELKRLGFVKSVVMTGSKSDRDFIEYLTAFWDYDKSEYVKEKLRHNHGIHRAHCLEMERIVKQYWKPVFDGRLLGEITKDDIANLVELIGEKKLSADRKNRIIRAGSIALSFAYRKEIIEVDIVRGMIWFSGKSAERHILTPEAVKSLFANQWNDSMAKLASMTAACTGLRAGEICALRGCDLGDGCIYVRHSWNKEDRLKSTKNNEERTVQVSIPMIMNALITLAHSNPHKQGAEGFVFYSPTMSDRPIDEKVFIKKLRVELTKIGFTMESAKKYTFHSWRHFYTSYMSERVPEKILQKQTGHKSLITFKNYAGHETIGDAEKVQEAQTGIFSGLLPEKIDIGKQERIWEKLAK